jgi:hypothetical protein
MSTASATALPAQTIVEVIDGFIESESISAGARLTAIGALAAEAKRRGFDPELPIDSDALDTLVVDALPSQLWMFA